MPIAPTHPRPASSLSSPLSPTCPSIIPLHRGSDSPIATPPRSLHQDLRGRMQPFLLRICPFLE
ncbi:unnamed protein product [Musa acuminata subsp. malaccensis]|uniref:(wild Malaysian banana) hypothetical protein n=1 Tax=Musa acuminata subsp. malaccensis TaxID=214687 RepID=A0A804KL14_MUSAM|nr:unnamed protein product [Musa acuminata subsp. malaccensis]